MTEMSYLPMQFLAQTDHILGLLVGFFPLKNEDLLNGALYRLLTRQFSLAHPVYSLRFQQFSITEDPDHVYTSFFGKLSQGNLVKHRLLCRGSASQSSEEAAVVTDGDSCPPDQRCSSDEMHQDHNGHHQFGEDGDVEEHGDMPGSCSSQELQEDVKVPLFPSLATAPDFPSETSP
jgi:hypothetical protein